MAQPTEPVNEESSQTQPPSRRWKALRAVLLGCLLAAMLFLAWQLHIFLFQRGAGELGHQQRGGQDPQSSTKPATNPWDPQGLLAAAREQLRPFSGDPAGVAPPAGARPLAGSQQHAHGMSQWHRSYQWQGAVRDAQQHYVKACSDLGLRLVESDDAQDDIWEGKFMKDVMTVDVRLGKLNPDDKTIRIAVIAVSGRQEAVQP